MFNINLKIIIFRLNQQQPKFCAIFFSKIKNKYIQIL